MTDFTGFAVIGAGNLGVTVTIQVQCRGEFAYLTPVDGHPGNTTAIEKAGGEVKGEGDLTGTFKIDTAVLDVAMSRVKDLVITTVADGHPDLLRGLAKKYDLSNYTLFFMPGGHGPALVSRIFLPERAPRVIVTMGNSPWVCRFDGKTLFTPGIKKAMPVSISYRVPAEASASNLRGEIFKQLIKTEAMLKIKMLIPKGETPVLMAPALVFQCEANPTIHVAVMLEGKKEIEAALNVGFYTVLALKPEAIKGIIAADKLRQDNARKFAPGSWPDCHVVGLLEKYYDHDIGMGEDVDLEVRLTEYLKTAPHYQNVGAPTKMAVRQLTEDGELQDIQVYLGKKLGNDTSVMEDQMARTEPEIRYKLGNSPINPYSLGLIEAKTAEELFNALNGGLPYIEE